MGQKQHSRAKIERRLAKRKRQAERIKQELDRRIQMMRAFTETIPRPENPGERCYKCGTPVEYKITKGKPKPHQTFGYRGYLWCMGCKTLYHCDKYRYWINEPVLDRECDRAIATDHAGESFAKRLQRAVTPRLIKRGDLT